MKISVVMPSLNQVAFLPRAIESVLSQRGSFELELIVVDGGSTDGCVEVLSRIDDARLTWTTGPDDGQSDAINRGMARANGDLLAWLNSDDTYAPDALQAVCDGFARHPDRHWLTGQCDIVDRAGRSIRRPIARYKNRRLARYTRRALLRENFISQPATFWRRKAWRDVGPLDTGLHWTMDYDLWLRLSELGDPLVLQHTLARFRLYDTSKTGSFNRAQYDEGHRVAKRYAPSGSLDLIAHRFNVEKIVWAYRVMKRFKA